MATWDNVPHQLKDKNGFILNFGACMQTLVGPTTKTKYKWYTQNYTTIIKMGGQFLRIPMGKSPMRYMTVRQQ